MRRTASTLAALLAAVLVPAHGWSAAGPAQNALRGLPGTIVYIRDGNIWAVSGSTAPFPVTRDGRYRSPSMADDGTIGSLRDPGSAQRRSALPRQGPPPTFVLLRPDGRLIRAFPAAPPRGPSWPVLAASIAPDASAIAFVVYQMCMRHVGSGTAIADGLRIAITSATGFNDREVAHSCLTPGDAPAISWVILRQVLLSYGYCRAGVYDRGAARWDWEALDFCGEARGVFSATATRNGTHLAVTGRIKTLDNVGRDVFGPWETTLYALAREGRTVIGNVRLNGSPTGAAVAPDGAAWAFSDTVNGLMVAFTAEQKVHQIDPRGASPVWSLFVLRR